MNLNEKKILFADLDGTLIQTASGKTFAEDCTDFRRRLVHYRRGRNFPYPYEGRSRRTLLPA